jgi:epoxyqueuosine reductase
MDAPRVKDLARRAGFVSAAVGPVGLRSEEGDALRRWLAAGNAADMSRWMGRAPERRLDARSLLPEAAAVISLAVPAPSDPAPPAPGRAFGRVARHAWGADYHDAVRRRLENFRRALAAECPELRARAAVDSEPLLERAFARDGGLGFVGRNMNLIVPGVGSRLILAELVVNLDLKPDPPLQKTCGDCAACRSACPTGAMDDGFLNAGRCIAYHTMENRGPIPPEIRPRMGSWVFGCDACQDVCPRNDSPTALPRVEAWPELSSGRGAGPWLSLSDLLALRSEESFQEKFRGTAMLRARRAGLVRNACVAARNAGTTRELRAMLAECRDRDVSPIVREHAAWALETA